MQPPFITKYNPSYINTPLVTSHSKSPLTSTANPHAIFNHLQPPSRPIPPPGSGRNNPDSRGLNNGGHSSGGSRQQKDVNRNKMNNQQNRTRLSGTTSRVSTSIHGDNNDNASGMKKTRSEATQGRAGGGSAGSGVGDTGMIVGVVIAVSVAVIVLVYAVVKYRNRDEGSYKIDESKNYGYVTASTGSSSGKDGGGASGSGGGSCGSGSGGGASGGGGGGGSGKLNGNVKYSKDGSGKLPKKKDIKEWYV